VVVVVVVVVCHTIETTEREVKVAGVWQLTRKYKLMMQAKSFFITYQMLTHPPFLHISLNLKLCDCAGVC
jgi:hypothetical protein